MRGEGKLFQHPRSRFIWMQYCHNGKVYRESTGEIDDKKARKKLNDKLAEIRLDKTGKVDFAPNSQLRIRDLLDALEADYRLRQIKSLPAVLSHLKPLKDSLGAIRAQQLTSEAVDRYVESRLQDRRVEIEFEDRIESKIVKGRAKATVNRETQLLRQAFTLAIARKRLRSAPQIRHLSEKGNERRGFFEKQQFEQVVKDLPDYLKGFTRFAYLSAWRKSEVASLTWQDVDMLGRVARLRPEKSKNGTGRLLALEGELWQIIERQWKMREHKNPDETISVSLYVFHRDGLPVGDIRRAWATACKNAKAPGMLFHDLRRTAVRNMVRAGVPERVAMAISGHKTRSIFDRYNIVSEEDLRQAMVKTQAHLQSLPWKEGALVSIQQASVGGVA